MNEEALQTLVDEAVEHSDRAVEALESGQFEAAQVEMVNLATKYQAYCDELAEEGPEQQENDSKDHESPDGKSGVGDVPHSDYCVD